ncbi:hypothetical protein PC123_g27030 [Phytophthora cactorum]|nr:hypothetical protein PC123_g27030 [Phytophthora cactorum]
MLVEDGPHAGCRFPSHLSLTAWLLTVRIPTLRTANPDAGYHSKALGSITSHRNMCSYSTTMPPGHRSSRYCSLTALLQGTGRFTALLTDNHLDNDPMQAVALKDGDRQWFMLLDVHIAACQQAISLLSTQLLVDGPDAGRRTI